MAGRLAVIGLLDGMTPADRDKLETQCTWSRYKKDSVILDRESTSRDVFFVTEGEVQVVNFTLSGRPIAYAALRAGDYFGELSAIDGLKRSANVVAASACTIGALSPAEFNKLVAEHGDVAMRVMRRLAHIVRACDERIMDLATLGAMQRVILELTRLATPDPITPGSWMIYPCLAQREIANRAATTRETVARVFTQLMQAGQIRRKGRSLYLKDRTELERLAQRLDPKAQAVTPA